MPNKPIEVAISRLSIMRSAPLDEHQVVVYADALDDCDPTILEEACRLIGLEERSEHEPAMPSVGTIRKRVRHLEMVARTSVKLLATEGDPRALFRCHACEDNDWIIKSCPGGSARTCGRPQHGRFTDVGDGRTAFLAACQQPHTFAVRCPHVR